jgi:anthranilate phosphoribosyltransferase
MRNKIDVSCIDWSEQKSKEYAKNLLQKAMNGVNLSRKECQNFLLLVLNKKLGKANASTFGALFASLMTMRKPTIDEITGFLNVVQYYDRLTAIQAPRGSVGIVGSGKDDIKTFNISTGAALVAASCGATIIKNGSGSESGISGTSDVMELFGVNTNPTIQQINDSIKNSSITFVDAKHFFPRMNSEYVGAFLFINPLSYILSVASAVDFKRIVFGLAAKDTNFTARLLQRLNFKHSLVVNGRDMNGKNIDEISTVGPTKISEITGKGHIKTYMVSPTDYGIKIHNPKYILQASTKLENAKMLLKAIHPRYSRRGDPKTDIVALNAAAALYIAEKFNTIEKGLDAAYAAIESGKVLDTLYSLIEYSGGNKRRLDKIISGL